MIGQLKCASCGAPLSVRSAANVFPCEYCGTTQLVVANSNAAHLRTSKEIRTLNKPVLTERDIALGGLAGEFPSPAGTLTLSKNQPAAISNVCPPPNQKPSNNWRTYRGNKTILTLFWCVFGLGITGIFSIDKLPDMVVGPMLMIGFLGFPSLFILAAISHWKNCRNTSASF